jgi:hypothetical protein
MLGVAATSNDRLSLPADPSSARRESPRSGLGALDRWGSHISSAPASASVAKPVACSSLVAIVGSNAERLRIGMSRGPKLLLPSVVLGVSAEHLQFSQDRFTTLSVHRRSLFGRAASPCSQPQIVLKMDEVRLDRFSGAAHNSIDPAGESPVLGAFRLPR